MTSAPSFIAVDPAKRAGICYDIARSGERVRWTCATDGTDHRDIAERVTRGWMEDARVCVVEWPRHRSRERASWAALGTMFARAAYWEQAAGAIGLRVVRVEPHVWQRATGAVRPAMRAALARSAGLTGAARELTIDELTAVCIALWYERVAGAA